MSVVKYKDFQGAVDYEDGRLVIQILHIDDFVTTECDSAEEVEAAFKELVEDYLETCAAVGKEPSKAFRGSFNVRVDPQLHKKAAMAAATAGSSLNAWVETAMRERLGQVGGKREAGSGKASRAARRAA